VGLGLAVAAGFCFRVSAFLLALGLTYIQLIDVSTYLNHYYLAALLIWLLAFTPAHRRGSLDVWIRGRWASWRHRLPPKASRHVPAGVLWLFRFQIGLVYFCAGLAKLQPDWLVHGQPLRIWLGASTDLPVLGPLFTLPGVPVIISWLGFLFDISIVFWLSWARTRVPAYLVVLGFHALTRLLFDIGMFPWIMSACALVFFPPDTAGRSLGALVKRAGGPLSAQKDGGSTNMSISRSSAVGRARWVLAPALIYVMCQVIMPFRYLAYGGNVLWHEQGMRFSWRVMVRAKGGTVSFLVKNLRENRVVELDPHSYLSPFQENEMVGQPDLILQMAHHVGHEYEQRMRGPVAVYARALSSLNGRRPAPLIDPTVDLMQVQDSLAPASWILPSPRQAPRHIRPVL